MAGVTCGVGVPPLTVTSFSSGFLLVGVVGLLTVVILCAVFPYC